MAVDIADGSENNYIPDFVECQALKSVESLSEEWGRLLMVKNRNIV
jgi:hypothetical protein